MRNNTIADSKYNSVIVASLQNLWPALFLIAIFCLAVLVRLNALPQWLEQPDRAFYGGEPLLPSVDGYYYLSLSQDLLSDNYAKVNEMRGVPDSPLRPSPVPMLSWLGYVVSKYTGLSLNWIAMLLPAMLGSLIVFPVYAYGKKFNGRFMGVCSALFAALSVNYVARTGIGSFDTDCLIISLSLCVGLFFWNFSTAEKLIVKVSSFIAALLTIFFFYLWWEQTPDVVFLISAIFFCIGLLFFYRPSKREGYIFYGLLCSVVMAFTFLQGGGVYTEIFKKVSSIWHYITSDASSLYPNIGGSIAEQQSYSFQKVVEQTTGTVHVFILSVSGLLGLLIKRKNDFMILSVFVAIGLLGVFYASRFLIFLSPVLALGLGFFLSEFWRSSSRLYRFVGGVLFFLLAVVYCFHATYDMVTWPYNDKAETQALFQLKQGTPDDAVVWSTWGKGYLINYWAGRATVSDGALHSGQLSHYLYWPLSQENMKFAANFIKFFSVRGRAAITSFRRCTGMNEKDALNKIRGILSEDEAKARALCDELTVSTGRDGKQDCQDWYSFFFPVLQHPVYLFLHQRMLFSNWWYWYGTWDIDKQEGVRANYALFPNVMFSGDGMMYTMWGRGLNLKSGTFSGKQLAEVYDLRRGSLIRRSFPEGERIVFVDRDIEAAVLMEEELWNSVFNRLFVRSRTTNQYFELLFSDGFNAQVWRVR